MSKLKIGVFIFVYVTGVIPLVAEYVGEAVAWILLAAPFVIFIWHRRAVERRFVREAPDRVQKCMATMRGQLAAGAGHLEAAESELESGIAPLFWDAMDRFPQTIEHSRMAWNEAVDVTERYDKIFARRHPEKATPLLPDASLPATVRELGDKWLSLRRQSLADAHFASIFEQRRQAAKIADRFKRQEEQIQMALDTARRAEASASQAAASAAQAGAMARRAESKASHAESKASHAESKARHAESRANHAVWLKM